VKDDNPDVILGENGNYFFFSSFPHSADSQHLFEHRGSDTPSRDFGFSADCGVKFVC